MIDIHAASDEEHADRGNQRPEEFFLTAAERVFGVRAAPAAYLPDLQQYLIGDVGERVDRLGEERRRAGDEPAEGLGRGDRGVRDNGGGDGGGHVTIHPVGGRLRRPGPGRAWAGLRNARIRTTIPPPPPAR